MNMFLAKLDMLMANFGMLLTAAETDAYQGSIPGWLDTLITAVKNVINPNAKRKFTKIEISQTKNTKKLSRK